MVSIGFFWGSIGCDLVPQVASIEYRLPSKVPEKISLDYTTLTAYADKLLALIGCCGLRNWLSVDMVCVIRWKMLLT